MYIIYKLFINVAYGTLYMFYSNVYICFYQTFYKCYKQNVSYEQLMREDISGCDDVAEIFLGRHGKGRTV